MSVLLIDSNAWYAFDITKDKYQVLLPYYKYFLVSKFCHTGTFRERPDLYLPS